MPGGRDVPVDFQDFNNIRLLSFLKGYENRIMVQPHCGTIYKLLPKRGLLLPGIVLFFLRNNGSKTNLLPKRI